MNYDQYNKEVISAEQLLKLVNKVVGCYVAKGSMPAREAEDAEMSIFEKYWEKREKIAASFQGKAKFSTFCIAVINRMCCEHIRKEHKHWHSLPDNEGFKWPLDKGGYHFEAEKLTHIKAEIKRLSRAFLFFNDEAYKLKLFLKYFFEIPICEDDINNYATADVNKIKVILNSNENLSKGDKFEALAAVVNSVESKEIKSDSVRMWLNSRTDTLISALNLNGKYNYDRESLSVLMELQNETERAEDKSAISVSQQTIVLLFPLVYSVECFFCA